MLVNRDNLSGDSLVRIEINPSLPCGIGECGQPARYARIERDPRYDALWRLLPICEAHLRSLDAAGRATAATAAIAAASSAESSAAE